MNLKVFISDAHLGDGSKSDDFHRDKQFLIFLDFVFDHRADLYSLGDMYELWQARLDRILWAHAEVYEALTTYPKYHPVWGES